MKRATDAVLSAVEGKRRERGEISSKAGGSNDQRDQGKTAAFSTIPLALQKRYRPP